MHERKKNLVVRLDEQEHSMVRAFSEASDEPATKIVRKLLRDAYVERFGVKPPPKEHARTR